MTLQRFDNPTLDAKALAFFRGLFVLAALWNLAGGILGFFNPAYAFNQLFDQALVDPLYYAIYRGACGTTLVYFVGYLVVAADPVRHTGIVLVGGIGKVGFAVQLLKLYVAGIATSHALIVIIGDFAWCLAFAYYYFRLVRTGQPILFGASPPESLGPTAIQPSGGGPAS